MPQGFKGFKAPKFKGFKAPKFKGFKAPKFGFKVRTGSVACVSHRRLRWCPPRFGGVVAGVAEDGQEGEQDVQVENRVPSCDSNCMRIEEPCPFH
jgi:hypothetical protein